MQPHQNPVSCSKHFTRLYSVLVINVTANGLNVKKTPLALLFSCWCVHTTVRCIITSHLTQLDVCISNIACHMHKVYFNTFNITLENKHLCEKFSVRFAAPSCRNAAIYF